MPTTSTRTRYDETPIGGVQRRTGEVRIRLLRMIGVIGLAMAVPFFVWLPAGAHPSVPTMVEVFGIAGLRMPAAITICGLLLAAVGFHDY